MSAETAQAAYQRVFGVLFQLTKLVNSGATLPELLRAVSVSAVELSSAEACSVMLLDEARQELLCKASHGLPEVEASEVRFKVGEGVAGWVAEKGTSARVVDVAQDARFVRREGQLLPISSLLAVPLATREGVIGVLTVTSAKPDAFTQEHEELLAYLGGSIVKDIENARLYRLSITDALTKAYNRQYLFQRLPEEIDRAQRYGDPFSVVLLDVDGLAKIVKRFDATAGDFVLKEVARAAQSKVREVDAVVRYGGDEFLLLLPKTPIAGAVQTAERIRAALHALELPWVDGQITVAASFGAAQLDASEKDEELLKRVSEALFYAKLAGGDRVVGE